MFDISSQKVALACMIFFGVSVFVWRNRQSEEMKKELVDEMTDESSEESVAEA